MKKIENISGNSLNELRSLYWAIDKQIETYSHVSEFLPIDLLKALNKLHKDITIEFNKRENNF